MARGIRPGFAVVVGVLFAGGVAFAEPDVRIGFGRPSDPRGVRPQLCLSVETGPCGELDEDGELPLIIAAPKGSMVWVGDETAMATSRGFAVRLDPLAGFADAPLWKLRTLRDYQLEVPLRVEGPEGVAERRYLLVPNGSFPAVLDGRVRSTSGGLRWAARYDASATARTRSWWSSAGSCVTAARAPPTISVVCRPRGRCRMASRSGISS